MCKGGIGCLITESESISMPYEVEGLLCSKLLTIFPSAQLAPNGTFVNSASGDPVEPFALYRRVSTTNMRSTDDTLYHQVIDFEVAVSSLFWSELVIAMPDYWTAQASDGGTWYFTLDGQQTDEQNFQIVFTFVACRAF
jgi:hypothetical protein